MDLRPSARKVLADNVYYLMHNRPNEEWGQQKVGDKAGVAQTTITNMCNPDGPFPTLKRIELVAHAFGLEAWQLLLPTLVEDLKSDTSFLVVYEAYHKATPNGRRHIQRLVEREAEYATAILNETSNGEKNNPKR